MIFKLVVATQFFGESCFLVTSNVYTMPFTLKFMENNIKKNNFRLCLNKKI